MKVATKQTSTCCGVSDRSRRLERGHCSAYEDEQLIRNLVCVRGHGIGVFDLTSPLGTALRLTKCRKQLTGRKDGAPTNTYSMALVNLRVVTKYDIS